jgi:crotonobetainyl-CoA:carnitine CoA-transferase CaiB-like acyl-CoA transferase
MASGPLAGIRILEFTQIIAGPFACQNLSDMGAEVIKVEPPGGEPWRVFAEFMPKEAKYFQSLNRGKQSLVLALEKPEAQEIVHRLIPDIDVVVVNYRPDVAARLRIDYETLSGIKSDLIYADNTAFGREGPWSHRPGYDLVVQAVSGVMALEGKTRDDGAPDALRIPLADYGTGLALAWGVTAALYHREKTGEGQVINATLLNTALAFQGSVVMDLPAADAMTKARMERVHKLRDEGAAWVDIVQAYDPYAVLGVGNIYYRTYRTQDGAVTIGALSASLWEKVRRAVGTDFLGPADPNYNPLDPEWRAFAEGKVAEVEETMLTKGTDEWLEILEREGVPSGPVNFPEDMGNDAQVLANNMMVELEHDLSGPQRQVAPLLRMSKTPLVAQGASPPLGRDTDAVVQGAGYSAEEIASLREQGVIE